MAKPEKRSAARLAAVQALYEMDLSGKGVSDALAEFEAHWIGREVEGIDLSSRPTTVSSATSSKAWSRISAPSTSRSTPLSRPAGRWRASRRCCAPSCAPAATS